LEWIVTFFRYVWYTLKKLKFCFIFVNMNLCNFIFSFRWHKKTLFCFAASHIQIREFFIQVSLLGNMECHTGPTDGSTRKKMSSTLWLFCENHNTNPKLCCNLHSNIISDYPIFFTFSLWVNKSISATFQPTESVKSYFCRSILLNFWVHVVNKYILLLSICSHMSWIFFP
jgi:hypothetical protein